MGITGRISCWAMAALCFPSTREVTVIPSSALRPLMAGGKEIQVDGTSAPCVVDWNADGQLDVLVGTGNGQINVYYAATGEEEPAITHSETIELNGQSMMLEGAVFPFPVDWNEDGSTELLIGTGEGEMYLAL